MGSCFLHIRCRVLCIDKTFLRYKTRSLPRVQIRRQLHNSSFTAFSTYRYKQLGRVCSNQQTQLIFRLFNTSARRNFDPFVWPVVRNVLKASGVVSGRGFRAWWNSLPDKKKQYFFHSVKKKPHRLIILFGVLFTSIFVYHHTHLKTTPITGRKRFIAFTDEQFEKISSFNREQCIKSCHKDFVPDDDIAYAIVLNTVNRIIRANQDIPEIKNTKWMVAITSYSAVNAFVLPTGDIFVNRGLLDFVLDQDQLAFVLAHEMAHSILNHSAEKLSQMQWVDYFVITTMTVLWALMPTDGIAVVFHWFLNKVVKLMLELPYNRFLENEADKVGLELAAKACFDIRSGTVFWTLMSLSERVERRDMPEWRSTHPSSLKRAELFDCLLHKYLGVRHECKCPPLPETDPRHVIHDLKVKVDNVVTARKSRANIERFKLPPDNHDSLTMAAVAERLGNDKDNVMAEVLQEVKDTVSGQEVTLNKTEPVDGMGKEKVVLVEENSNVPVTSANISAIKDCRKSKKD